MSSAPPVTHNPNQEVRQSPAPLVIPSTVNPTTLIQQNTITVPPQSELARRQYADLYLWPLIDYIKDQVPFNENLYNPETLQLWN